MSEGAFGFSNLLGLLFEQKSNKPYVGWKSAAPSDATIAVAVIG